MKLHLIDAFTDKAFSGNPAAVVLLDQEPTDFDWMQSVAMEMNQAETAFVWPLQNNPGAEWGLRWFTPAIEIQLCGHATLASAYALWSEGLVAAENAVRFFTPMASHYLSCELNRDDESIRMCFPAIEVESYSIPEVLVEVLGETPTYCARSKNGSLLLQYKSAEQIRSMQPDFQALEKATDDVIIVTALSDQIGYDVISRFFAPGKGINEDSVTGSAHCIIGPWWSRPLKQKNLVCYQASARGGVLKIELQDDKVFLSGNAVTTLSGDWKIEP